MDKKTGLLGFFYIHTSSTWIIRHSHKHIALLFAYYMVVCVKCESVYKSSKKDRNATNMQMEIALRHQREPDNSDAVTVDNISENNSLLPPALVRLFFFFFKGRLSSPV